MLPKPIGSKTEIHGAGNLQAMLEIERWVAAKKAAEEEEDSNSNSNSTENIT